MRRARSFRSQRPTKSCRGLNAMTFPSPLPLRITSIFESCPSRRRPVWRRKAARNAPPPESLVLRWTIRIRSSEKRKAKSEKRRLHDHPLFAFRFSLFVPLRLELELRRQHDRALPARRDLPGAKQIGEDDVEPVDLLDLLDELIPVAHHQLDPVAVRDE